MDKVYLYIESNGIFIVLLCVLLVCLRKQTGSMWEERLFKRAILLNIGVLIADTGTWIFDGYVAFETLWINKLVFCAYYVLTVMFVFVWMLYAICKLRAKPRRLRRYMPIIALPLVVAEIMSVGSLWTGWCYKFDAQGAYIRGELFMIHTAILWLYFFITIIYAVRALIGRHGKRLTREGKHIIISVLFPILGGLLQTLFYGLNLAWTSSCISFVIMFISIQNKQALTDALTGIYNRGAFTEYLAERINSRNREGRLFLLMMDINRFKMINDNMGHVSGDEALKAVAKMLTRISRVAGDGDFLARYGGDEFAYICSRKERADVEKLVEYIREESRELQGILNFESPVTMSIGWAEYHSDTYATEEEFIEEADRRMYVDKAKSREAEADNVVAN